MLALLAWLLFRLRVRGMQAQFSAVLAERARIAREIHDNVNQRIALISIELEQLAQRTSGKTDGLGERVSSLQEKAMELSNEIHRLSYELHPSKLDYFGLSSALGSLCREMSKSHGLAINFRDEGPQRELSNEVSLCLFRVAQEAIGNAVRHSGTSSVDVALKRSAKSVRLTVCDSGRGLDAGVDVTDRGLGIISMKERLRLFDGELKIASRRSHGTRIEATIPAQHGIHRGNMVRQPR